MEAGIEDRAGGKTLNRIAVSVGATETAILKYQKSTALAVLVVTPLAGPTVAVIASAVTAITPIVAEIGTALRLATTAHHGTGITTITAAIAEIGTALRLEASTHHGAGAAGRTNTAAIVCLGATTGRIMGIGAPAIGHPALGHIAKAAKGLATPLRAKIIASTTTILIGGTGTSGIRMGMLLHPSAA